MRPLNPNSATVNWKSIEINWRPEKGNWVDEELFQQWDPDSEKKINWEEWNSETGNPENWKGEGNGERVRNKEKISGEKYGDKAKRGGVEKLEWGPPFQKWRHSILCRGLAQQCQLN